MSRRFPKTGVPRLPWRQCSNLRFDIPVHDGRSHIIWEWLKMHAIAALLFRSGLRYDHKHCSTGSDFQANNSNLVTQANRRTTAFPKDKGQLAWVSETHLALLSTLCERSQHSLDLIVLYKKRFGTEIGRKICHRAQK